MFNLFKRKNDPLKEIKAEINSLNFDDYNAVIKLVKPTIVIDIKNQIPKIGTSKFGGFPDLSNEADWPKFEGKPMVFFCQISILELVEFDCGFNFEKPGLISIFHHFNSPEDKYGAEYDFSPYREEYQILFFEKHEKLKRTPYPKSYILDYKFEERAISFIQSYQIPGSPEHSVVINSNLSESDKNKLYDYADRHMNIFESQIGGYPLPVQGGADLEWASSKFSNLEYLGSEFINEALKFENLLSFSFQHDFETIGDSNMYIGITREDLEKSKFEDAILIHQST
jgi:uncharacterized protein YwqG